MMYLNDIAEQAHALAKQRGLRTDAISSLKHCAGEVVEATEAFTKLSDEVRPNMVEVRKQDFSLELADVIICALTASYEAGIDIEEAISEAMQKNAQRAYGGVYEEP